MSYEIVFRHGQHHIYIYAKGLAVKIATFAPGVGIPDMEKIINGANASPPPEEGMFDPFVRGQIEMVVEQLEEILPPELTAEGLSFTLPMTRQQWRSVLCGLRRALSRKDRTGCERCGRTEEQRVECTDERCMLREDLKAFRSPQRHNAG